MSSYINELTVMGNLGQDPVLAYMSNGDAALNISVATTEKWTDKQTGEVKENTEWHKVLLYRKTAEIVAKYMKKGDKIWVRGKVRSRVYTDRDGAERIAYELIGNEMKMIQTKGKAGSADAAEANNASAPDNPLDQFS